MPKKISNSNSHPLLSQRSLLGLLAGLLMFVATSRSVQAEEWRIATLAPDGSSWMKILSRGAADVESKTSGRVKVKYYTGGKMGGEKDVIRKMKMGALARWCLHIRRPGTNRSLDSHSRDSDALCE